jgi:hypothetical protein
MPEKEQGLSARALLIGSLITAFLAWFAPVAEYRIFSSSLYYWVLPPGVVFMALVVLGVNLALRRFAPARMLSTGELVIVISMAWLGTVAFNQIGAMTTSLAIVSAPEYFATAENRWAEYYLAYIPQWTYPSDSGGAMRYFYNGLPLGQPAPWSVWASPFVWWGSLIAAMLGVSICLMAMVHEQWHDHEKLRFPLADVPLDLIGQTTESGWSPGWITSKAFWLGASLPMAIIAWNMVGWFLPLFPHIAFTQDMTAVAIPHYPNPYSKIDFFTVGLGYFAPLSVLRGFWLGRLLVGFEVGLGRKFGFAEGMNKGFEPWSDWGSPTVAWQCLGCLTMFVLWGLWMGREHFTKVLRSAIGPVDGLPDQLERRYRAAVWGLCVCLAYLALWFRAAGMSWAVIGLFLPMLLILTLGISKLIVESSMLTIEGPVSAQTFAMQTLGTTNIPQASMAALVISYVVFRSNMGLMMPQVAFAGRMGDEHRVSRGKLYTALGIAVVVAIVVAAITTIWLAYQVGAFNFQSLSFRESGRETFDALARSSDAAFGTDYYRWGFFGGGMAIMAGVLWARLHFANFWLHPIGLTFATTSTAGLQTINILIVWLIKWSLERLGGHRLVQRCKPFFLGLVCGQAMGVGLSIAVDAVFFPGHGHRILTGW